MKETYSAGVKEFLGAIISALVLYFATEYFKFLFTSYKSIADLVQIIVFAVYAFFVLTRYCAVYTYELKNDILRINRKIGHRNKELEIHALDMHGILTKPAKSIKVYTMKKTILHHKDEIYVNFENNGRECAVCFTPSVKMAKEIKKTIKRGK